MFSERFVYQPNHFGNFDLSGPAILHKNIAKDYSQEDIDNLSKEINLRLEFRKSDRGHKHISDYGYCEEESFNDLDFCKILELRAITKERLKSINPSFREVIRNKIKDLELKEARKHESKIRAWNLVVGLILGLTIAGVAAWLFNT